MSLQACSRGVSGRWNLSGGGRVLKKCRICEPLQKSKSNRCFDKVNSSSGSEGQFLDCAKCDVAL